MRTFGIFYRLAKLTAIGLVLALIVGFWTNSIQHVHSAVQALPGR